jgi:hypothetical protein
MNEHTHPFQVRHWLPEQPALKCLGQAQWMEECRCQARWRAETIARSLHAAGYGIQAVVKLPQKEGEPVQYVAWFPNQETVERETGKTHTGGHSA